MTGSPNNNKVLPFNGLAPLLWNLDFSVAVEIIAGDGVPLHGFFGSTSENHLTAVATGTGTDVNQIVGIEHSVLVVLHHDDGVANVSQFLQGLNQPVVVPLVEADARLIQDVKHPSELRSNLCGQTDALSLAA